MAKLINAIMAVSPAVLGVGIFLCLLIVFGVLWALKTAHRDDSRGLRDIQGQHIQRLP